MGRGCGESWRNERESGLFSPFSLDLDIESLDFLVQGGQWNLEPFSGLGLVAIALFQHVGDYAALALLNDVEQGSVGALFKDGEHRITIYDLIG
jgi:hypothetical protein